MRITSDDKVTPGDEIKQIIKRLETLIPIFEAGIDDNTRVMELKNTSIEISRIYKSMKPEKATFESMFKLRSQEESILNLLSKIYEILAVDLKDSRTLMSEGYIQRLKDQIREMLQALDTFRFEIPKMTVREKSIPDIIRLVIDHPECFELFATLCVNFRDDPRIRVTVEVIKQHLFRNHKMTAGPDLNAVVTSTYLGERPPPIESEKKLPDQLVFNMINCYYRSTEVPIDLPVLIEKELGISGVSLDNIDKISKPVILIVASTAIKYNSHIVHSPAMPVKFGISANMIENTRMIERVEPVKEEAVLYPGSVNLLENRRFRGTYSINPKTLVLFSTDRRFWIKTSLTYNQLAHLFSGPNYALYDINRGSENKVLQHWRGPRELVFEEATIPASHIKQKIVNQLVLRIQKFITKDTTSVDIEEFLVDEEQLSAFDEILYTEVSDFIERSKVRKIVLKEAGLSVLSDIGIRHRQFIRESNHQYNQIRKKVLVELEHGNVVKVAKMIEDVVKTAIDSVITEMDNLFNTLDSKRVMFE